VNRDLIKIKKDLDFINKYDSMGMGYRVEAFRILENTRIKIHDLANRLRSEKG